MLFYTLIYLICKLLWFLCGTQGLLKKSNIQRERNKMVLEARFKRGSATHYRLTPFIPLKGDIATCPGCEYGKWH